jgi:hypothetical protein
MIKGLFHPDDLDLHEFSEIGLARDGHILLEKDDLQALLDGQRTGMVELKDLFFADFHIQSLKAKLSLEKDEATGKPAVLIHPLYIRTEPPRYLTGTDIEKLETGSIPNVEKRFTDKRGRSKDVLVEFDPETNEYIVTDISQVFTPDIVNGEHLSAEQKERYRRGKIVELEDGTRFQYAGTEREGIRANKIALIASILIDGGISFILYQGLNALFGEKHDSRAAQLSDGYRKAFSDMKMSEGDPEEWLKQEFQRHPDKEYSRGYGRSGTSR